MQVKNENQVAFKDMTPEERTAITEAWLAGKCEKLCVDIIPTWVDNSGRLSKFGVYRTTTAKLAIPWEVIKPELCYAVINLHGEIQLSTAKFYLKGARWFTDGKSRYGTCLDVDVKGIIWQESQVERPQ